MSENKKWRQNNNLAISLAGLLLSASTHAAIDVEARVAELRPFGYQVGDVVEQTVHLRHTGALTLPDEGLPANGRAGAWLDRQQTRVTREGDGFRIDVRYQFINSPPAVHTTALPALKFTLKDGDKPVPVTTDDVPLTLGPLTAQTVLARAGLEEMREDTAPPRVDTARIEQRLTLYAAALGAIAAAWLGWYFGVSWRGLRSRPFARALRALSAHAHDAPGTAGFATALRTLHRAFDATAGHTLFAEGLESFFAARPALAPARAEVERFFAASRAAFFGASAPHAPLDAPALLALARTLKRLERESAA